MEDLASTQLQEPIRFVFVDGKQGMLSREEAIFHLVNHSTYHRGASGHALDRANGNRPADTYTVHMHGAEPERRNA